MTERVNLDVPRWDQTQYWGRVKYFFTTTNPLNIFKSNFELEKCKEIVNNYKKGDSIPDGLTLEDVYKAKDVVDSAYHPETGDKMIIFGRMSAQVPMNMLITGCMVTFYKTTPAVIFWQWFNQSFNALVNYTNRSGTSPMPLDQVAKSYVLATSGALVTALSLNKLVKRLPTVAGRFVPFAAVAAANCINIPLMRIKELDNGIEVYDENKNIIGESKTAARQGITAVVLSRILMSAPGMVISPVIMEAIEQKGLLRNMKWAPAPLQIVLCGFFLTFATPMCCALYPQISPISIDKLEPELQRLPTVAGRFVPFAAVAAANCINIPLMRIKELDNGIEVYDENKNIIGESKTAARQGITAVVLSRILMSAPGMVISPVIMEAIEQKGLLRNMKWAPAPLQIVLCGFFLTFATPMCCALYPQISPISIDKLEPELQKSAERFNSKIGYYNKGL